MNNYWTKERMTRIGITFIGTYTLIFGFFIFSALMNNDLSWSNVILIAQIALLMNLLAMSVSAVGVMMRPNKNEDVKSG